MRLLTAPKLNLQETLQLYEETDNAFGPPGVLSNLALVAFEWGDLETAVILVQNCFTRFLELRNEARKVDFSSDFLESGDMLDSLLHAGLVAHAQGDWQTAVGFFTFFEKNERGYMAIRPLQEKVKSAKAGIQNKVSDDAYEKAVIQASQITLTMLLTLWNTS